MESKTFRTLIIIVVAIGAFVCLGLGFAHASDCHARHGQMVNGSCNR